MLTNLPSRAYAAIAGLGSAALLAGAFAFEHLGGLAPCALCIWQRWPHAAAVVIMGLALLMPSRWLMILGALAALTTAGVGGFHMGVEYGWWEGLQSCSGGSISGISVDDLLNPNAAVAAPVRCDAVAWSLFGLSMAGWNMVISLGLAAIWGLAASRS
ncbi:disulfide bond formation protein B [Pseudorhodobacter sp. MZDSW-24AT]|uniref:disulfide bond formation protein B n=1 Tax=Pseudorhodobacter sp. MZDSW-24AT TaxID=2052957 RepID=UPI000C1EA2B0|nr:disulfide bond formation protein B [Pseudorhodobacter sp. MZDSW-24AT]PJF10654.1 disulfide bond formation protein B [Pseudorhodobacter sp. MZDSW-24AT]